MSREDIDPAKLARAIRDSLIDASDREWKEMLSEESLTALVAQANSVIDRALESASAKAALVSDLHRGLGALVQMLRRRERLSAEDLAQQARVDLAELLAIEFDPAIEPRPRTVFQLAKFFRLPVRSLLVLSGAFDQVEEEVRERAVRFAAYSKGMDKLSREEKSLLNEFVRFLQEHTDS